MGSQKMPEPSKIFYRESSHNDPQESKDQNFYVAAGNATINGDPFPMGIFYLTYLLSSKGDYAHLFLDECVQEDRDKCELILRREFVSNVQRQSFVQKLLVQGSRLQEITDADLVGGRRAAAPSTKGGVRVVEK